MRPLHAFGTRRDIFSFSKRTVFSVETEEASSCVPGRLQDGRNRSAVRRKKKRYILEEVGKERESREKYGKKKTYDNQPSLLVKIDMYCIDAKLVDEPREHDHEDRIGMIRDLRERREIDRSELEPTDRKKKDCIVEREKEGECPFRYEETDFAIFFRIFLETVVYFLDFRHFSL